MLERLVELIITPVEARILGCLIEKQATTPDVYPITLNGLLTACNQKTNREPVMNLSEAELLEALDSLIEKDLASTYRATRNRTLKYQHRLHLRAFDEFNFTTPELAVLAVLFLRGPQTPGEIRARCSRIHEFPDIDGVTDVLQDLESNEYGPYVTRLPREPGRKEHRYGHLFCGEIEADAAFAGTEKAGAGTSSRSSLEQEVQELRERLLALETRLEAFVQQFE
jgi:uncharacterized protein YceH (UPF0502 family)